MPERLGSALLYWLNAPEVRAYYYAASVTTPASADAMQALWEAAQGKAVGPVVLAGAAAAQPPPADLDEKVQAILHTDQFRTVYQPLGANLASVAIADLIAPQVWADTPYAEELAGTVPADGDEPRLFDYCFSNGRLEAPMMLGMNAAVIVSGRRALGTLSPLRQTSATAEKATFEFDALPRPNWLMVYRAAETGQLVVGNGVHHVLGLMRAGRDHAYCMLIPRPVAMMFNAQDPGIFKPERLTDPRPPLVRDFQDANIADAVGVRATDQFMRFGVTQPDIGHTPQSE